MLSSTFFVRISFLGIFTTPTRLPPSRMGLTSSTVQKCKYPFFFKTFETQESGQDFMCASSFRIYSI